MLRCRLFPLALVAALSLAPLVHAFLPIVPEVICVDALATTHGLRFNYTNNNLITIITPAGEDNYISNPNVFTAASTGVQNGEVNDLAVCDFNGDGVLDVATASGFELAVWLDPAGSGLWVKESVVIGSFSAVACGDLDADGHMDVVGGTTTSALYWYSNTAGNGTAWTGFSVDTGFPSFWDGVSGLEVVDYAGPFGIVDDILVTPGNGSDVPILPLINDLPGRNGTTWAADLVYNFTLPVVTDSSAGAVMGVFGGNLDLDFVATHVTGDRVDLWVGGSFWHRTVLDSSRSGPSAIATGDLDGDGDDDVAVAWSVEEVVVIYHGPLDVLPVAETVLLSSAGYGSIDVLKVADMDGNGDQDLLVSDAVNGNVVLYRTGAVFGAPVSLGAGVDYKIGAIADREEDGDVDVWFASRSASSPVVGLAPNNLWTTPEHVFPVGTHSVDVEVLTSALPTRWRLRSDLGVVTETGNISPGGGSIPSCCGDGIRQAWEECDDGNDSESPCTSSCVVVPFCTDGVVNGVEECDDGNVFTGDGCDADCIVEVCGNGVTQINEQCDDNNNDDGDGCDANCILEQCGNGLVQDGEECDEGDTVNGDGCDQNCLVERCGNLVLQTGEECDDGNTEDGDGCDANCVEEECGNGVVQTGEDCDEDSATCKDCKIVSSPPVAGGGGGGGLGVLLGVLGAAAIVGVAFKLRPEPEPVVVERRRSSSIAPRAANAVYGSDLHEEAGVAPIAPDQDRRLTGSFSVVGLY